MYVVMRRPETGFLPAYSIAAIEKGKNPVYACGDVRSTPHQTKNTVTIK
jgi:hypothetical protein